MARCLSLTEQSVVLNAGFTIGTFITVEIDQVDDRVLGAKDGKAEVGENSHEHGVVPGHLHTL